jgi:hypothetical protein
MPHDWPMLRVDDPRECEVCQLLRHGGRPFVDRYSWAIAGAAGLVVLVFLLAVLHG